MSLNVFYCYKCSATLARRNLYYAGLGDDKRPRFACVEHLGPLEDSDVHAAGRGQRQAIKTGLNKQIIYYPLYSQHLPKPSER